MRRVIVGVVVGALMLAAACGSNGSPDEGAGGEKLKVVAAFYPLAEAAEQIGSDEVEVENLTPPGAEPHDIELTSDQLDLVFDADLILLLGEGFQPAIEEAATGAEGLVLDVLEGEELISEETVDPHVWLDAGRWASIVGRIGDAFARAGGVDGNTFKGRARQYADRIAGVHQEFESVLSSCDRDLILSSHSSFAYLAQGYGLEQESISGLSPEAEPDPDRLAELADLVEERGVRTIFTEGLVSPEVARTLARETGAEVATLDPLEGLTEEQIDNGEDYESVMRSNLEALRTGLGCD